MGVIGETCVDAWVDGCGEGLIGDIAEGDVTERDERFSERDERSTTRSADMVSTRVGVCCAETAAGWECC